MADIRVPTLGESVTEATVGKWFKQPGEAVAVDEPLVELETDKVTLEVPAPAAGVLSDIAAKNGDTVGVGALLGQIKEGAAGRAESRRCRKTGGAAEALRSAAAPSPCRGRPRRPQCLCRRRCAKWRRKAAWTRARSPAPACTGRSARAT